MLLFLAFKLQAVLDKSKQKQTACGIGNQNYLSTDCDRLTRETIILTSLFQ